MKPKPTKKNQGGSMESTATMETAPSTTSIPVTATSASERKTAQKRTTRVSLDLSQLPKDINVTNLKSITLLAKGDKKAYVRGSRVFLDAHKQEFGPNFNQITEEEAKWAHYGKTRSIGLVADTDDLKRVLAAYYNN
jgi:hypothetical protein